MYDIKTGMTREEAVKMVGEELVAKAERENCDFTNRVIDDVHSITEMSAEVFGKDLDGNNVQVQVIYNVPNDSMVDDEGDAVEMDQYDYSDYSFFITEQD